MRPAYFGTNGQKQDQVFVEAATHDFAVVPFCWPSGKPRYWAQWIKATKAGLVPHVPCCYMDQAWIGDFYDEWKKIGAWLIDDAGRPVVRCGTTLLNLRDAHVGHAPCVEFADALAYHLTELYKKVRFAAVFMDCVWDAVSWTADEGAIWKDRATLDREWKDGTNLFVKIVRDALRRLDSKPFIVGNGYTTCPDLGCRCIEGFPRGSSGWVKNVLGPYGAAKHAELYSEPAWFIPNSLTGKPGMDASDEDALATIALANSYYDNYGTPCRLDHGGPVLGMNSMADAKRLMLG